MLEWDTSAASTAMGMPVSLVRPSTGDENLRSPRARLVGRCIACSERSLAATVRSRRAATRHSSDTGQCAITNAADLPGIVNILRNITAQDAISQGLRGRAQYDELTELPNWWTFYEHVQRAIGSMKRRSSNRFGVLFVELDDFKAVNDEFGHIVADKLLAVTARRLEFCVRSEDIVARIGDDEFAILLNGINGISDVNDAVERIGRLMCQPAMIEKRNVRATVNVGIAISNPNINHPEDILRDADAAMYATKARASVQLFGT
jgi:diguanylate cyclase (GGDEF)-like protein